MTPYQYHNNKIGVKITFLISDKKKEADSLCLISYSGLRKRMDRKSSIEKELRRGCFNSPALVVFDSLPMDWRNNITVAFGNPPQEIKKSFFEGYYFTDKEAERFYQQYRYGISNKKLSPKLIEQYTFNASVINAVLTCKANRTAYVKALGSVTNFDIWQSLSNDVNAFTKVAHNLPPTKGGLRRKVKTYVEEKYEGLISGKLANVNSIKVASKEQQALIDELVAKNNNFDNVRIATLYNSVAKIMGFATITAQTVANRKQKTNLITYAGRNGKVALNNELLMQHKRSKPSLPMLYWTADGWDVELMYQKTFINQSGYTTTTYHNRLTAVMVLDPFNNYIIGYAIADYENPELIKQAFRNAIQTSAELLGKLYRPYQLQTDNYQKKHLKPFYEACCEIYTPAQVKNAKSKVIEPFFGRINKTYCQLLPNWSGYNMVSGSKNQPNTELADKKNFPTKEECINQIEQIINVHNQPLQADYIARFSEVEAKYKSELSVESYLNTIGSTTGHTNKLRGEGLIVTIDSVKHTYDCFDLAFRNLAHTDWTIKYDTNNLDKVLAVSADGVHQFMLEKKHIQPMAIADRKEGDVDQLKKIVDYNKNVTNHITDTRKENHALVAELMDDVRLNDTLAKHQLTDSNGQHKDNRNEQRKTVSKAKVIDLKELQKQVKQNEKTFNEKQREFHESKIDLTEYL